MAGRQLAGGGLLGGGPAYRRPPALSSGRAGLVVLRSPGVAGLGPVPDGRRHAESSSRLLTSVTLSHRVRCRLAAARRRYPAGVGTPDEDREVLLTDELVILPDQTSDDTDAGWGERPVRNDDRLLAERPPHWD